MEAEGGGWISPMQTATGQKCKRVANGMGNLKTNNKHDKKKTGISNMRSQLVTDA
jgi:hypothetical protein